MRDDVRRTPRDTDQGNISRSFMSLWIFRGLCSTVSILLFLAGWLLGQCWETYWWGGIILSCLTGSTEHCCSHPQRTTRSELLTWSFRRTIISMSSACACACVCACARVRVTVWRDHSYSMFSEQAHLWHIYPTALSSSSLCSVFISLLLTGAFFQEHPWSLSQRKAQSPAPLQSHTHIFNIHISSPTGQFDFSCGAHMFWL